MPREMTDYVLSFASLMPCGHLSTFFILIYLALKVFSSTSPLQVFVAQKQRELLALRR